MRDYKPVGSIRPAGGRSMEREGGTQAPWLALKLEARMQIARCGGAECCLQPWVLCPCRWLQPTHRSSSVPLATVRPFNKAKLFHLIFRLLQKSLSDSRSTWQLMIVAAAYSSVIRAMPKEYVMLYWLVQRSPPPALGAPPVKRGERVRTRVAGSPRLSSNHD
jgi:hypothetical protein